MKPCRLLSTLVSLAAAIALEGAPFTPAVDSFEDGNAAFRWAPDNGVWQVGVPANVGPRAAFSGSRCLATVIDGFYPGGANSRAIRAAFDVPPASEFPRLRFWQWFSIETSDDNGFVQIRPVGDSTWTTLSPGITGSGGGVWTRSGYDLAAYAGRSVELSFLFTSDNSSQSEGWYVDDVSIATGTVSMPALAALEDFEDTAGASDRWVADKGSWEIGRPSAGPGAAHSGQQCLATVLGGDYPPRASTTVCGPLVTIPPAALNPRLQFYHWFEIENGDDYGIVRITLDNGNTWRDLSAHITGGSGGWTTASYNLSEHGGKTARIGFFFASDSSSVFKGWYIDEVQIVTDGPQPPTVSTLPPTEVMPTSAKLQARVNPLGLETSVVFEYGTAESLAGAKKTPSRSIGSGSAPVAVSVPVTDLLPTAKYFVRAIATSSAGASQNLEVVAFHLPPTVTTGGITNASGISVTLNGTVNPNGADTDYHFEYGLTDTYGSETSSINIGSGTTPQSVAAPIGGLSANETYHYRLVAFNPIGPAVPQGADMTFTTSAVTPTVITAAASNRTGTGAKLNGTVNPNGSASVYYFEYGKTLSYELGKTNEVSLTGGNAPVLVMANLSSLDAGETYHYRLAARNTAGLKNGDDALLVTGAPDTFPPLPLDTIRRALALSTGGFRWRLQGDVKWLGDGEALAGLLPGEYVVELEPKQGLPVPPAQRVAIPPGTGDVAVTLDPAKGAARANGQLAVIIEPEAVATDSVLAQRGQWRFVGETDAQWRNGGLAALSLAPGVYVLEFKPATGRVSIPKRSVRILASSASTVRIYYEQETPPASGAALPTLVSPADATEKAPYQFVGQFQSDVGFGSGIVVQERVVLTVAHLVFDDVTLSYSSGLQWRFQRYRGQVEPAPITPRGSYLFTGYADKRRQAVPTEGPGKAMQPSQQLDAAAVFFRSEAGRIGHIGVLKTDAINNWLTQGRKSKLISYPVDLGFLKAANGYSEADAGKPFETPEIDAQFALVPAQGTGAPTSRVYGSTKIAGFRGGSGGALCIRFDDGNYYPAGIYLGGDGKVVVRAIDQDVADLIEQARLSSEDDTNHTTGGVVLVETRVSAASFVIGQVKVNLSPAIVNTGADKGGWKVAGDKFFRASGDSVSLPPGSYTLSFDAATGFETPAPYHLSIVDNELVTLSVEYAEKRAPQITTTSLPIAIKDRPYGPVKVKAANAPTRFDEAGLPAGLTLNKTTGAIDGTPTVFGENAVTISAFNSVGSAARTLSLPVVAPGTLIVHFDSGQGVVKGFTDGESVTLPQTAMVTLEATPAEGFVFERWTGSGLTGLPSALPKLEFRMGERVEVRAEFGESPFPDVAGSYRGLLSGETPGFQRDGAVELAITKTGSYSGKFIVGGKTYRVRGQFLGDGSARARIASGKTVLEVELTLDLSEPSVAGKLTVDAAQGTALGWSARRSAGATTARKYTLELPPDPTYPEAIYPQGSSVATVAVAATGAVAVKLLLADGAVATCAGFLAAPDGGGAKVCTLFAELYSHQGAILGNLIVGAAGQTELSGDLRWFRDAIAKPSSPFAAGWPTEGLVAAAKGYLYEPARAAEGAIQARLPLNGLTANGVRLQVAGAAPFTRTVELSELGKFKVTIPNEEGLKITLTNDTGLFTGSYKPLGGKVRRFRGILEQPITPRGQGAGFVLDAAGSDGLSLEALP